MQCNGLNKRSADHLVRPGMHNNNNNNNKLGCLCWHYVQVFYKLDKQAKTCATNACLCATWLLLPLLLLPPPPSAPSRIIIKSNKKCKLIFLRPAIAKYLISFDFIRLRIFMQAEEHLKCSSMGEK